MRRQRFVREFEREHNISKLCSLMEISKSGFYAWRNRPPSPRDQSDAELSKVILEIHAASRRTYGIPRVYGVLRQRGIRVGRKRVARLMRCGGLVGAHSRRKWRRGRPDIAPAPDLVQRDFSSRGINQLLVADITEFKTLEGKLYLAGVKDLGSNAIVGWSMSSRQTTELVIGAVVMAVERRNLDGKVVHHSDRGCQYTSFGFTQRLSDLGLVQSFGSTGDCYDNAAMESFWATLKRELLHIYGIATWPTRAALKTAIFDYIEVFYNRQRNQERLGHLPPLTYEDKLLTA